MKVKSIEEVTIYSVRTKEHKKNKNLKVPLVNHYISLFVDEELNINSIYMINNNFYTPMSGTRLVNTNDEVEKVVVNVWDSVYEVSSYQSEH